MSASSRPLNPSWLVGYFGRDTITAELSDRLRTLATDLDMLREPGAPDELYLKTAPLLENWVAIVVPTGTVLAGLISGHPNLKGPAIMTSPIWAIGSDLSWARTTSRFYRLGKALDVQLSDWEAGHVH